MRVSIIGIVVSVVLLLSLRSEDHQRYWIFFSDKDGGVSTPDNTTDGDYHGTPVSDSYVEAVASVTDSVTVRSRFLNAVSVPATANQLDVIRSFPFVISIRPVARMARPLPIPHLREDADLRERDFDMTNYYGLSETQIKLHDIHILHNTGITGLGARIGFLDTGYQWNQHPALQDASVVAERDFVAEYYSDHMLPPSHYNHGTVVFSVVAGYDPGTFIGVAHDAEFLLGATEDVRTERPIEEDFWVAGIEWMDEMGVDIVSTSLGYSTFDPPFDSYTPDDMDGKTAVTTVAADRAFERGILVVASAGNAGNSTWRIITAPADGRNVLAIGALHTNEDIAGFSSRGPSADGRIKPDISALGVSVRGALPGTGYTSTSGTSLSAPLVSGTAGLILSARPDLSAAELRNALRMSARRGGNPDNTYGYGILDAPAALAYPMVRMLSAGRRTIQTVLTAEEGLLDDTATLYVRTSNTFDYTPYPLELTNSSSTSATGLYGHTLNVGYDAHNIRFIITVEDLSGNLIRYPRRHDHEFYLSPVGNLIEITERVIPDRFVLYQNFPNPFNNRTVLRFELPNDDRVSVSVYDILGRPIAVLADDFYMAGIHELVWEPSAQASGVYIYRLRFGGGDFTGRMVYIR
jgi:subtilisin family serine protease